MFFAKQYRVNTKIMIMIIFLYKKDSLQIKYITSNLTLSKYTISIVLSPGTRNATLGTEESVAHHPERS